MRKSNYVAGEHELDDFKAAIVAPRVVTQRATLDAVGLRWSIATLEEVFARSQRTQRSAQRAGGGALNDVARDLTQSGSILHEALNSFGLNASVPSKWPTNRYYAIAKTV